MCTFDPVPKLPCSWEKTIPETIPNPPPTPAPTARQPKLLDQFRDQALQHGHTEESAKQSADWCRRFILFHGTRHPNELGLAEIGRFLQHVAATEKDALRALAAGRAALEFLYAKVLHRHLGELPLPRPPRLLDQVKQVMRVKHYAVRTEECYVQWIKRFILFHEGRPSQPTSQCPRPEWYDAVADFGNRAGPSRR
jgi:Phage integrase, N-terminal SAM-like domain